MALSATLFLGCEWTPPSNALREIKRLEAEAFVGDSLREDIGRQLMVRYGDLRGQKQSTPLRQKPCFDAQIC